MAEKKIRVIRTIVIEGEETWVRMTLSRSLLKTATPFVAGTGTHEVGRITERSRIEEELGADNA